MKGKNTVKGSRKALPKVAKKDLSPSRAQDKKVTGGLMKPPDDDLIP